MFSSHEEYQNILKYYLQNLVISILVLKAVEILFNVIYIVGYDEFFLGKQKTSSL